MPTQKIIYKTPFIAAMLFLATFVTCVHAEDKSEYQATDSMMNMMNPMMGMMGPMMNPAMYMNMMNPMMGMMGPMMNPAMYMNMMYPMMGGYSTNSMGQATSSTDQENWFSKMMGGFTSQEKK